MDKLTLCKRIAEIEGIKVSECKGILIRMDLPFGTSLNAMMSLSKAKTLNDYKMAQDEYGKAYYDPLTDDALCHRLMIKHTVILEYCLPEIGYFASIKGEHDSGNQKSPNRAILLAIVEANNG